MRPEVLLRPLRFAGLGVLCAALAACGRSGDARPTLQVYAAASLTEAFQEMEPAFELAHPDVDVLLTFAGSQVLRLQIEQGADADVFASANANHMRALVEEGMVEDSRLFARNELVVVVPPDNPAEIQSFADLPRARRLVIGTDNVPVGSYAREALRRAAAEFGPEFETDVLSHVVSEESNVRLARAKVELGEADAAIVYRTDAAESDGVRVVPIPPDLNVTAEYPIAVVAESERRDAADAWLAFVLSDEGRDILVRHGFTGR